MSRDNQRPKASPEEIQTDDEFEWPRLLGQHEQTVDGTGYASQFSGGGYVASAQDEGSFLSNLSRLKRRRIHAWMHHRTLSMENLFPEDWYGSKVEYHIKITARRLSPRKPRK